MVRFFHSVRLDADKCKGCTNCIKRCPTEAIRVRDGKALIIEERCIDCGECIRVCPNHAKFAYADSLSRMQEFKHNIALPAPALFGQFKQLHHPSCLLDSFQAIGFDDVLEVSLAADYVTLAIRSFLDEHPSPLWVSSSCPAIVRLIQVRFPELIPHLVPIESPMEVAGSLARQEAVERLGLNLDDIGVWFITPCPAKVTAIHQPVGLGKSNLSGAFPISVIYGELLKQLPSQKGKKRFRASGLGLGWGRAGGENTAIGVENHLAVDGVHSLISLFEELEMGHLRDITFLECQACIGGCVGGALTVENPFVARVRLRKMAERLGRELEHVSADYIKRRESSPIFQLKGLIEPRPIQPLAEDMRVAIQKMEELEGIVENLPGLDCGACGSPSCRVLAEDIVRGVATETDCVIKLRERLQEVATEMLELAKKLPPTMSMVERGEN